MKAKYQVRCRLLISSLPNSYVLHYLLVTICHPIKYDLARVLQHAGSSEARAHNTEATIRLKILFIVLPHAPRVYEFRNLMPDADAGSAGSCLQEDGNGCTYSCSSSLAKGVAKNAIAHDCKAR